MTRLRDMTLGELEERVAASSLTPTGHDSFYDVDPEEMAEWLEAEAYIASLVDPTPWVDADDVVEAVGRVAA